MSSTRMVILFPSCEEAWPTAWEDVGIQLVMSKLLAGGLNSKCCIFGLPSSTPSMPLLAARADLDGLLPVFSINVCCFRALAWLQLPPKSHVHWFGVSCYHRCQWHCFPVHHTFSPSLKCGIAFPALGLGIALGLLLKFRQTEVWVQWYF